MDLSKYLKITFFAMLFRKNVIEKALYFLKIKNMCKDFSCIGIADNMDCPYHIYGSSNLLFSFIDSYMSRPNSMQWRVPIMLWVSISKAYGEVTTMTHKIFEANSTFNRASFHLW